MSHGIFITGTDTGVGKTYVAERIARVLHARGVNVGVMKPAETGCRSRSGALMPGDALRLMKAAQCDDPLALVNPYRFRKPLAPSVAAELEGVTIDPRTIVRAFRTLSRKHEFMIVEGAGGIMVPLSRRYTYIDLVRALGLPVVIVARPNLGTINHTLLTVSALQKRGITIAGIVINHAARKSEDIAERTTPSVIAKLSNVKILCITKHREDNLDLVAEQVYS